MDRGETSRLWDLPIGEFLGPVVATRLLIGSLWEVAIGGTDIQMERRPGESEHESQDESEQRSGQDEPDRLR